MTRKLALFAIIALASAACDELSSVDDPRESESFTDDGYCSGIGFECLQLPETACAAAIGCDWSDGCYDPERDQCFSRTASSSCEQSAECNWSDEDRACFGPRFASCDFATSRSQCEDSPIGPCLWGATCKGDATSCYGISNRDACVAQPGCNWI